MIIYVLTASNLPGDIRYVGQTSQSLNSRVSSHVYEAMTDLRRSNHKANWVRSVIAEGHTIQGSIIAWAADDIELCRLECFYIKMFRDLGFSLTNSTDGGDGVVGLMHSEATRKQMSEKQRARVKQPATGHKPSPEAIEKTAAAHRGTKHSPEAIEKMRLAATGRRHSEETKQKMSASRIGMELSEEHKLHISKSMSGVAKSDEHREKLSQANKNRAGWHHTEGARQTLREKNTGRQRSEEARAKQSAATKGVPKSLEHIERQRQAQIATWQRKREAKAAQRAELDSAIVPDEVM